MEWENFPHDVIFLEINPDKDQDLQVNYNVNFNVVTHPKDWIGLYDVSFYLYLEHFVVKIFSKFFLAIEKPRNVLKTLRNKAF